MKNLSIFSVLMLVSTLSYSQLTNHTIEIDGSTRDYIQYLPDNYQATENLPLLFVLHGLGGNAQSMTTVGFNAIADTARVIVIYPDGVKNAFDQQSWNNGTFLASSANDVSFFVALMDKMVLDLNVKSDQIYFTGFSMGSIMSHHMACELNDRVAAIGAMAGPMATSDINSCVPAYATPVIHLHGTADATVPYDENALPSLSLVPETMDFWENVHSCTEQTDSIRIPDINQDGITIDQFVYTDCTGDNPLELWRFNDADHIILFDVINDIHEAKEVWKFLRRWNHPNPTTAQLSELDIQKRSSVYPNPNIGSFSLYSSSETTGLIYDSSGKLIDEVQLKFGKNILQLDLENGIYFFQFDGKESKLVIQK